MIDIEQNMLRERADKLDEVTDEMWNQVNEHNRYIVQEYFDTNPQLSKKTVIQYWSALKQFFWFIKIKCKNKPLYEITKRDFLKYRSYLMEHGLSSSGLNLKKAAVSSLCNFIETIIADEEEDYKTFRNFTRGLPALAKNQVYEKIKVSVDEYQLMMKVLEDKEDYLGMAWTATAFNVGGRRNEIRQFKTEILDYKKEEGKNYILTHTVRGKGKSVDGKPLRFMCNEEAIKYMKLWVEKRGYKHEYIFTTKYGGEIKQISESWANYFCKNVLSKIVGRRINPHLFKASAITYLLEQGKDIKAVSKFIAHHKDVSTTQIYDLRDLSDERNKLFE